MGLEGWQGILAGPYDELRLFLQATYIGDKSIDIHEQRNEK